MNTKTTYDSLIPHILYVEDDEDAGEMISVLLRVADESYEITTIETAQKALDLIEKQSFDLYILDYALPGMSGVELCRRIRETDSQTPILFYSGMARGVDRQQAMQACANEFLVKPNDLDKFTETVRRLLLENSSITRGKAENKTDACNRNN